MCCRSYETESKVCLAAVTLSVWLKLRHIDVQMMSGLQVTSTAMQLLPLVCVSLLTWSVTTFGDGNGPAVINMVVKEDSDVVLPCSLSTTNIMQELFDWKKDDQKEVFMYDEGRYYNNGLTGQDEQFKGRVLHFPKQLEFGNASIIINKTKVTDSGRYTCDFPRHQPERRANIELVVVTAPKPIIMILDQTKDWALLRCEVQGASPELEVEWQDRAGNVLPAEKTQLSDQGGRFDITLQTTVTKTDHYRCVATQKKINHQIYTETFVHLDGAASKPVIIILDETKDWALLRCEVRGHSPEPEVEWQDRAGNVLPGEKTQFSDQEGRSYITLQTTVTKTGHYRCVATQKKIKHQIYTETLVHLDDKNQTGFPVGWVLGTFFVTLLVVGVGVVAVLGVKRYKSQERKKGKKEKETSGRASEERSLSQNGQTCNDVTCRSVV